MIEMFHWPKCYSKKMTEMSQRKNNSAHVRLSDGRKTVSASKLAPRGELPTNSPRPPGEVPKDLAEAPWPIDLTDGPWLMNAPSKILKTYKKPRKKFRYRDGLPGLINHLSDTVRSLTDEWSEWNAHVLRHVCWWPDEALFSRSIRKRTVSLLHLLEQRFSTFRKTVRTLFFNENFIVRTPLAMT